MLSLRANRCFHGEFVPHEGIDVMERDWDNLLILDACRYDYFVDENWLDGDLTRVTSPATNSLSYLQECFIGRELHDTVYVTGNPYAEEVPPKTFHDVVPLYGDEWDEKGGTVRPETVAAATEQAATDHPNKRLVAHFMQPHVPYIGRFGSSLEYNRAFAGDVWSDLRTRYGDLTDEDLREAYRENLRFVLEHVEQLLDELDGKTVITADHGELLGERIWPIPIKGYDHYPHLYTDGLTEVPWLVLDDETRREIVAEEPQSASEERDADVVADRLEALGYA
ncbi:sulfatase-like hydrolase/transferase [Halococcus sp. AFM35]|uniref:sulfatase-like hydrolase/transferase n=1 Tax=Halococcus sp. AFM35 TaxID=3421653 RepID=UPI003EBF6A3D